MFQQILVAIDGSESSQWAAEAAIELAALLSAQLDILSVEETPPRYVATHDENTREHSAALTYYDAHQAPLREHAKRRGVQLRCAVLSGHEGQVILNYIQEQHCDLLILGYQGHSGVWGAFLGSTADKLVSHALCSTLVIRSTLGKSLFKNLLVALDGSPLSWQAFHVGLHMAKSLGATLHTLSVVEGPKAAPTASPATVPTATSSNAAPWNWTTYFQQVQTLATAQSHLAGLSVETITREGSASSVITTFAREDDIDLLILGATGQERPWSPITGGTARKIANEAPCAVLLVRPFASQYQVSTLMSIEVATIMSQTPLSEVISQLIEHGVKMLVVTDEQQHVLGIITLGHLLAQDDTFRHLELQHMKSADQLGQYLRQLFTAKKTAGDVMIRRPLVVKGDITMDAAAHWMVSQHITRMPVVDADERLVGMIDQTTLLRSYVEPPEVSTLMPDKEPKLQARQVGHPQRVGEALLSQVPLVATEMPLSEIMRQVQATPLRRVIVINHDGKALGVIGDRDLLSSQGRAGRRNPIFALAGRFSLNIPEELFRRRATSGPLTAQQVMRPHLIAVTPATPVAEAVRLMLAHQIKRLVVVDEGGMPLGFVDRQQLLRSLVEGGSPPV